MTSLATLLQSTDKPGVIQRMNDFKEVHRQIDLVLLEMPNHVPTSARQLPRLLSGLLNIVFAEVFDAGVQGQLHFLDGTRLGDGDKLN